ncbi:hypothetical protein ACQAYK_08960 [Acidithiobacillus sp. AC3]
MGIVANIKAKLRPVYTPPLWTTERLAGLVRVEEYITFREARASLILWVVIPQIILAGVTNGPIWIPAVLLASTIFLEPHLAALKNPGGMAGYRRLLSMPWQYWWSRPLMAVTLLSSLQTWGNGFSLLSLPAALGWLVLAFWVRHRLLHGQKMDAFLQMYRTLGVTREAPTKA